MGNFRKRFDLMLSSIGVTFSISATLVFLFVYDYPQAATWAALSGIFGGICLQLHYVHWADRLENYHNIHTLNILEGLGFIVMLGGVSITIWYLFTIIYWHEPILPVKGSQLICAVWSFITGKWGFCLFLTCKRYQKYLRNSFTPLRESI